MTNHALEDLPPAAREPFIFTSSEDLAYLLRILNIQGPFYLDGNCADLDGTPAMNGRGLARALIRHYGATRAFPRRVEIVRGGRFRPIEVHTRRPRRHVVIETICADGDWQLKVEDLSSGAREPHTCVIEELLDLLGGDPAKCRLGPPPGKLDALVRLSAAFKQRMGLPRRASLRNILLGRAEWY